MERGESLSALDRAMVEMIWQTTKSAAKGRRNVNRPHTAMYSSSSCPRRFITVFRSTWQSAAVSARATHMRASLHEHPGILCGIRGESGEKRGGCGHAQVPPRDLGEEMAEVGGHGEVTPFEQLLARES